MIIGALIGVAVAVAILLMHRRNAQAGTGLAGQVEQALRARGPSTVREVAAVVGKDSFLGRGSVTQALGALHATGKARVIAAPPGTPQLKKIDVIKYEAI